MSIYRSFYEMGSAEAIRYRDLRRAQHELKVIELRQLVGTVGSTRPVLDNTMASLGPLWTWIREFADDGLPGIPAEARTLASHFQSVDGTPDGPTAYLGELVEHYIFDVIRSRWPAVAWETYLQAPSRVTDADDKETGILIPGHPVITLRGQVATITRAYLRGRPSALADDRLERFVAEMLPSAPDARHDTEARPVTVSGSFVPPPHDHDSPVVWTENELIFARPDADTASLESAPPLDHEPVIGLLRRNGYTDESGAPVSASSVLADGVHDHTSDAIAVGISTFGAENRLRALFVEVIDIDDPSAQLILNELDALGTTMGCRLAPAESM